VLGHGNDFVSGALLDRNFLAQALFDIERHQWQSAEERLRVRLE
jgi:hypothetical protein